MSNARSPREVCSTTMGTSGLMVLALFRLPVWIPSGRPERPSLAIGLGGVPGLRALVFRRPELSRGGLFGLLVGRPDLLARLRLLSRDRLRARDELVDGLAVGEVGAQSLEAPGGLQLLEQLLGRRAL